MITVIKESIFHTYGGNMPALKYSRQRESIKKYLCGRTDHPTAEKIYADLRSNDPKLSLGTVYRNLSLLTEIGEIRKISTLIGPDHFDANTSMHYHFICQHCHSMSDIAGVDEENVWQNVAGAADGHVEQLELVAYGTCRNCEKQM